MTVQPDGRLVVASSFGDSAGRITRLLVSPITRGDASGDAKAELFWRDAGTGALYAWLLDGLVPTGYADLGAPGARPHASPSVRKFARELGVDLQHVAGSGPKGRITPDDVREHVKAVMAGGARAAAAPAAVAAPGAGLNLPHLARQHVDDRLDHRGVADVEQRLARRHRDRAVLVQLEHLAVDRAFERPAARGLPARCRLGTRQGGAGFGERKVGPALLGLRCLERLLRGLARQLRLVARRGRNEVVLRQPGRAFGFEFGPGEHQRPQVAATVRTDEAHAQAPMGASAWRRLGGSRTPGREGDTTCMMDS